MKKKLILAVLFLLAISATVVINLPVFQKTYKDYLWQKNRLANDNFHSYSKFDNIQINDFIKFESLEGVNKIKSYNYAKIIEVSQDSVKFQPFLYMLSPKLSDIEANFEKHKSRFPEVLMSKADLEHGICDNYLPILGFKFCGIEILNANETVRIVSIDNTSEPVIKFSDADLKDSGKFYISFYTNGIPLYLSEMQASNAAISFYVKTKMPFKINKNKQNSFFAIAGEGWDKSKEIALELTFVEDTINHKRHVYKFVSDGKSVNSFKKIQNI
jgi:hypothetical protein